MVDLLKLHGFNYVALDLRASCVQVAKKNGHLLTYGNGGHQVVLDAARLSDCKVLVITFGDKLAVQAAIKQARMLNPNIPILVWAKVEEDIDSLTKAGATQVIPRDRETSLMLESSMLHLLGVSIDDIMMRIQNTCASRYPLFGNFIDSSK